MRKGRRDASGLKLNPGKARERHLPKLLAIFISLWMSKLKGFPLGKQRLRRLWQFLKTFCFSRFLLFLYINKKPLESLHNTFHEQLSMVSHQPSTALLTEHCLITFYLQLSYQLFNITTSWGWRLTHSFGASSFPHWKQQAHSSAFPQEFQWLC